MDDITRITAKRNLQGNARAEACLVQIYGPMLGRKYALETAVTTIGRGESCEIVVELDNVSRRHCAVLLGERGARLRDEGSTNGTWLNDAELRGETELRSGDLVKVGSAIFKFLDGSELGSAGSIEAQYHEEIYRLTIIDGLTQVHNKRYLLEFLEREMSRCARHGRPLSVVLLDVDHFKRINDSMGHLAGDAVLRELAAVLRQRMRKEECIARYGGEEFVLVLPETDAPHAIAVADRMRSLVEERPFAFEGKRIAVTFSAGVAQLSEETGPLELLGAADAKLYSAKRAGRNRVAG